MKKFLAVTAMFFAACAALAAQEARIVHYDADAKADSKRPDFKGSVIAIDFDGTTAVTAKALFMKLGARNFSEGKNPCVIGQTVICVRVSVGNPMQASSNGQISGYGGSGYTTGGSFSGQLYPINLDVFLVVYNKDDGGDRPTIPLGRASCLAPAGSGSSFSSSYGRNGGGTYSSNDSSDLNATMGNAVNQDLTRLLSRNVLGQFLAWGTYAKWLPGADTAVKNAFRR